MPRVAYPGSRGYCRPRQGVQQRPFIRSIRMLRVRQGHSLNSATVRPTSPLPSFPDCALSLTDFHEVSRAVGPKLAGSKISFLMPKSQLVRLGSQGFEVCGSFVKYGPSWPFH